MIEKLKIQLDTLNREMEELFLILEDYTDEQLNTPPQPGAWSALQTMHHLLRSEELSQNYIEKKLSFEPTLKRAGISTRFRSWILRGYLRTPFKFKAPQIVATESLPEKDTLEEIKESWRESRERLEFLLNSLPREIINRELYKHPIAGRMTVSDMLAFFQQHFSRHKKQILKALYYFQ